MDRVVDRQELASIVAALRAKNKKIVTTNGCFDILHIGHIRLLNGAKALGDVLIVGVNGDQSVRRLKGPERPIVPEDERAEVIANLKAVDYVTVFSEDTPIEFLKVAKPNVHVKGGDYKIESLSETPIVESMGGTMTLLDLVPNKSTTNLVAKLGPPTSIG